MNEPLVLIPGLMADARVFLPQIVRLGAERPVIVAPAIEGETVEQMSAALIGHLPPRFALIGHGLGGDVALDIVRRLPNRVTRAAFLATDPMAEPPQAAAAREARIVAARSGRLAEAIRTEFPDSVLGETPWRDDIMALIRDMAFNLGEGAFLRQSRALQRRPDQQRTMRAVKLPALILAGEVDPLVPLRRQEFMAKLMPFGALKVIAGAGHFLGLEQPEAVTEALDAFLKGPMLLR